MSEQPLVGKSIAILVANGFDEIGMTESQRALLRLGAAPKVISPEANLVNGWHGSSWGHYFPSDKQIGDALAADFDLLLLPGGERSVTKLSQNPHTRRIISSFMDAGKGVAAMDHGVQLLGVAQRLKGRTVTAVPAVRAELEAAGATWSDETIVVDRFLVTGQSQDNTEAFIETMIRVFGEAVEFRRQWLAERAAAAAA